MNHIGTTTRRGPLTVLAGEPAEGRGRGMAGIGVSTRKNGRWGCAKWAGAALQYCLPGVPCIYYGDEAGMERIS